MGEEYYTECLKNKGDGKTDGCQMFSGMYTCDTCSCEKHYHRRVVRYTTEVVYTECHKMHRDESGLRYKDGCKDFVRNGNTCFACGCPKSFHRNEIIKDE